MHNDNTNKLNILGVLVSRINREEVLERIENWLKSENQHYIVTPNPEIILEAQKDEELKNILNKADIAVCDGTGLVLAGFLLGQKLNRVQGSDLVSEILKISRNKKYKIYFLNWSKGLSKTGEIKKAVQEKFGPIEIDGRGIERSGKDIDLNRINNFKPAILLVALGAPHQEKIISEYLLKIPSIKAAMGVGGTFDFITKKVKRAPFVFRCFGLEWLWRLVQQPNRIKRIFDACAKFPFLIIKSLPRAFCGRISSFCAKRGVQKARGSFKK